jgi:L-threonylcarbamoyladenylate synthase
LILYPTDTIWGIGCDATNASAVEKIYKIKKRPDEKKMIVLVSDEKDISKYVAHPTQAIFEYLHSIKKPTTVVYEEAFGLANNLIDSDGTIAIRICKEEFCQNLIHQFRKPIVSTSANISGQSPPEIFSKIKSEIKEKVDYVVRYRQDDDHIAEPSSVIKWNKNGTITVIRL